jgi:hypothetical protein
MADFSGPRLDAYIAVATTQYRPEFSVVPFSVEARDIKVELGLPRWDTHRGIDGSEVIEVGKIGEITIEGSYRYYSEPKPEHLETLSLHLEVSTFTCLTLILGTKSRLQGFWLGNQTLLLCQGQLFRRLYLLSDNGRVLRPIRSRSTISGRRG